MKAGDVVLWEELSTSYNLKLRSIPMHGQVVDIEGEPPHALVLIELGNRTRIWKTFPSLEVHTIHIWADRKDEAPPFEVYEYCTQCGFIRDKPKEAHDPTPPHDGPEDLGPRPGVGPNA